MVKNYSFGNCLPTTNGELMTVNFPYSEWMTINIQDMWANTKAAAKYPIQDQVTFAVFAKNGLALL